MQSARLKLLGLVDGTVGAQPHYYLGATVLCQLEVWEVSGLMSRAKFSCSQHVIISFS